MKKKQAQCTRVVVDTNTLVDAIFHEDTDCANLFQYKHDGEICFCMNIKTYQEAYRIFLRTIMEFEKRAKDKNIKITERDMNSLFYKLTNALWEIDKVDCKSKTNYCKEDPDDNKFIDCYIDGKIEYLISSDKHLLELKDSLEIKKHGIKIMNPKDFSMEMLLKKFSK